MAFTDLTLLEHGRQDPRIAAAHNLPPPLPASSDIDSEDEQGHDVDFTREENTISTNALTEAAILISQQKLRETTRNNYTTSANVFVEWMNKNHFNTGHLTKIYQNKLYLTIKDVEMSTD